MGVGVASAVASRCCVFPSSPKISAHFSISYIPLDYVRSGLAMYVDKVRSIAGHAGWEAPKAFVAGMVATLESEAAAATATTSSTAPLRFGEIVADLIIDDTEGKWWLTQARQTFCLFHLCVQSHSLAYGILVHTFCCSYRLVEGVSYIGQFVSHDDHRASFCNGRSCLTVFFALSLSVSLRNYRLI